MPDEDRIMSAKAVAKALRAQGNELAADAVDHAAGQSTRTPTLGDVGAPMGDAPAGEDANIAVQKAQAEAWTRDWLGTHTTNFAQITPGREGEEMSARLRELAGMNPGRAE